MHSYNRLLWRGIAVDAVSYPERRSGLDLSRNRAALLEEVKPPAEAGR